MLKFQVTTSKIQAEEAHEEDTTEKDNEDDEDGELFIWQNKNPLFNGLWNEVPNLW